MEENVLNTEIATEVTDEVEEVARNANFDLAELGIIGGAVLGTGLAVYGLVELVKMIKGAEKTEKKEPENKEHFWTKLTRKFSKKDDKVVDVEATKKETE